MINFIKIVIMAFCFLFFSGIIGFAQDNEVLNISSPELSKMFKGQNGLISSSEMQVGPEDKSNQSDKYRIVNTSKRLKKTKPVTTGG